jgi:hypothetical protein
MQNSTSRKAVGILIALTGFLGIVILGTDRILWESLSGRHAYGLIAFVVIDFAVAAYVAAKAGKMAFTVAAAWSAFRVVAQLANVYSAAEIGLTYAQFANYLLNPIIIQPGNPPGIPAVPMDLIIILEIVVVGIGWKGRSAAQKTV